MKNRKAFDDLREYLRVKTGNKVKNDEIYNQAIMSDSKFSKILKGEYDFSPTEAKRIADYFFELGKDKAELDVLCEKLAVFLYDYYDKSMVTAYLKKLRGSTDKNSDLPRISKDAEVIRKTTEKNIKKSIELDKIVYLYGAKKSGKSFIAKSIAHYYYDSDICNVAIWNDCKEKNTFDAFLSNLLSNVPSQEISSLSLDEKEMEAKKFLSTNSAIFVIDNFECCDDNEKERILTLISETQNAKIILVSEKEMKNYKYCLDNQDIFSEIKIHPIRKDEWDEYVKNQCKIDRQIDEMIKANPEFPDDLYKYCGKNPTMLIEEFNRICKNYAQKSYSQVEERLRILSDTSYDLLFNNMPKASRYLLIALSFFKTPVSLEVVSKITGIPEASTMSTNLIDAYDECKDFHFITDDEAGISLRATLRPFIEKERFDNPEYQNLIKRMEIYFKDSNAAHFQETVGLER